MVKDQFRYGRLGEITWKKRMVVVLIYVYDAGGLVSKVIGRSGSDTYEYVKNIGYNQACPHMMGYINDARISFKQIAS